MKPAYPSREKGLSGLYQPRSIHDARHLGRSGALYRNLLVALERIWYHGDWASVDEDGCWFLHGRADESMNVRRPQGWPGGS